MAKGFNSRGMGGFGGGMNMNMMKQVQKMQQDMMKMQQELETKTYTAAAGGGVVSATVTGKRELKEVVIAPEAVDPEDVEIEAGIDGDSTFSWVVIENASQRGEARSATLPLPAVILEKVREGEALGPVMSRYTGIDEIGRKEGAIGVFTAGKLTRASVYHQAVILALSPFHNAVY